ncbi:MAG: hypothetical protein A2583_08175 [Bdellovibrionales bacterium RIFOXYD1_FULL_53_11]|nr:MAG: hypothetical protein A2583_08175 [Bdellovibrionales bacterium RIFOXYD1_FULL_53_11]
MDNRVNPKLRSYYARLLFASQLAADAVTVFLCYLAGYWIYTGVYGKLSPQSFPEFLLFAAAAALVYVVILDRVGMYQREVSLLNVKELRGIFYTGLYAAAVIMSASFYLRSVTFSRITLTAAMIMTPVALYLQRQVSYRLHLVFHAMGWVQKRVLVFGAQHIGQHIARRLFESPFLGLLPVGFLDDDASRKGSVIKWHGFGPQGGVPVLGGEEVLARRDEYGVDMVLIALPSASFERNQKLVERCIGDGIEYAIVPNTYEKFIQDVELFEVGGIPIFRRRTSTVGFYYLLSKRLMDFSLSAFFMLVLSPVYALISLAIRLESRGPVIFKQKRSGLGGREFSFYKFRSMFEDAPRYARTPSDPADPRITRVGRWLRRTSLDELPQLFNVLRGDMSLVGPRPEMPFIVAAYTPLQLRRLEAKPGITGVWQISAYRGDPIHENIEYDLFYLQNRSLLLDVAIIVKTMLSVVRGVGAV